MYICSDHFTPESFLPIKGLGRQKLKPDAVPSIFPNKSKQEIVHLKKKVSVIFQRRVIEQGKGICFDKNLSAAIQSAVVEQLGSAVFDQSQEHFFDHYLSTEADHLTTLLRFVTEKYVLLCLKTYSKRFTEMVVHKNEPSLRHRLTKTILFKNQ